MQPVIANDPIGHAGVAPLAVDVGSRSQKDEHALGHHRVEEADEIPLRRGQAPEVAATRAQLVVVPAHVRGDKVES